MVSELFILNNYSLTGCPTNPNMDKVSNKKPKQNVKSVTTTAMEWCQWHVFVSLSLIITYCYGKQTNNISDFKNLEKYQVNI